MSIYLLWNGTSWITFSLFFPFNIWRNASLQSYFHLHLAHNCNPDWSECINVCFLPCAQQMWIKIWLQICIKYTHLQSHFDLCPAYIDIFLLWHVCTHSVCAFSCLVCKCRSKDDWKYEFKYSSIFNPFNEVKCKFSKQNESDNLSMVDWKCRIQAIYLIWIPT